MQFIFEDGIYKVARITGSQYNLLGIRLSNIESEIRVFSLPVKTGEISRIDEKNLLTQVESGLKKINEILNKTYFISEIYFISSDTYFPDVYEYLIMEIIKRIDSGGKFIDPVKT